MAKSKFKSKPLDDLFDAFKTIQTKKEWYQVFEDLCTVQEMRDLGLRFEVAKMLNKGQSYQEIIDQTGASSTTISRVAKALSYGQNGYQLLLKKDES